MEFLGGLDDSEWLHRPNNYSMESAVFVCLCAAAFANGIFALAKRKIPEPKRLAWVLSCLNAFVATVAGFGYLFWRFFGRGFGGNLIYGNDNVSVTIALVFAVNTALDLVWGVAYYPKYLDPLSAWFHHSAYLFLLYKAITRDFSQGFTLCLMEELPTFLLGAGTIWPWMRNDLGFGLSFFVLRILWHGYILYYHVSMKLHVGLIVFMVLTSAMHVQWFSTWVTRYGLPLILGDKYKAKGKKDKNKATNSSNVESSAVASGDDKLKTN